MSFINIPKQFAHTQNPKVESIQINKQYSVIPLFYNLTGGKSANVLQELQIPVLKNQDCSTRYEKIGKLLSSKQFDNAVICK